MTEPTLSSLTARLERMERESRRWKGMSLLMLVGGIALAVMGQTPQHRPGPRTLEAEEFVLRDPRGQVRASLGMAQNPTATVLQIHGDNGKPRTRITVASDGTSSLEMMDGGERVRVLLGVKDSGLPRIWLGNENGRIIWRAP